MPELMKEYLLTNCVIINSKDDLQQMCAALCTDHHKSEKFPLLCHSDNGNILFELYSEDNIKRLKMVVGKKNMSQFLNFKDKYLNDNIPKAENKNKFMRFLEGYRIT